MCTICFRGMSYLMGTDAKRMSSWTPQNCERLVSLRHVSNYFPSSLQTPKFQTLKVVAHTYSERPRLYTVNKWGPTGESYVA